MWVVAGVPAPPKKGKPNLVANFLPVWFKAGEFEAGVLPFESDEQLADLRTKLTGTHAVRRENDDVVCVPLMQDAAEVGEQRTFMVGDHHRLAMFLVKQALIREVVAMKYTLSAFARPRFVSRYPQQDLLRQCADRHQGALAALHVFPEFSLDTRTTGPSNRPGVLVGLKTRYEIDLTVCDLLQAGLDVEGRYVLAETGEVPLTPDLDERVYRRLAGAIESVRDGRLHLTDAPRLSEVDADQAWIEGSQENFHDVIALLAGRDHTRILEALAEAKFELLGADGRLQRVAAFARKLKESGPMEIAPGLSVDIGLPLGSPAAPTGAPRVNSTKFEEPPYIFDPGRDKTHRNAERGLTRYGPFDSQSFSPRTPKIVVLTPQAYQGSVDMFMDQFLRGVPGGKVYPQGFVRKYQLAGCDIAIKAFDAGPCDAGAYRGACLEVTQTLGQPDLAIVITSTEQEFLRGDASPYLVAKSTLMNQGIVVQEIQIETIRQGDLDYPLDSIALQCYAKLGGIPFVIAAPQTITHEIIIGIGSAHVKPSRFGTPERVVGITTVFNADGSYILSNTSREADYERYPEELLRALRTCIEEVQKRNAWQVEDAIRLVFHVFKPLKDTEAEAVKLLVEGLLTEFRSVEFAFVHISEAHDWTLFDTASVGWKNQRMPSGRTLRRGWCVPHRGHAVSISPSEILLTVTGPFDLKVATQGLPRPLLLKLHRASTFTDIDYLAGQVFRFTALSWRGFYPSSKPITIFYSDLIAKLLGQLRHVRNWNADVISTRFRTKKWFL